jgi:hypothetical protein
VTEEEANRHARLARLNLLSQMRSILGYLLVEVFGQNRRHARSAIGVASLAGGITAEGPPELDRSCAFDVLRFWNLRQGRKNG